jgi:hypothetical protein
MSTKIASDPNAQNTYNQTLQTDKDSNTSKQLTMMAFQLQHAKPQTLNLVAIAKVCQHRIKP